MKDFPIVISGFGRSGTTWLSDILSKVIGGLILFEPFHPAIFEGAEKVCYSSEKKNFIPIVGHLKKCFAEEPKNPWLLRNHLSTPIQNNSEEFLKYVWKNSVVLGFKTIRCNHILELFHTSFNAQIILIHRHPLAVLVSINNRMNFWNEFGWDWHHKNFFRRTIIGKHFNADERKVLMNIKRKVSSKAQAIILMWALSFIIGLRQINLTSGFILSYEDLYIDPFTEIKNLLDSLHLKNLHIHPSHLFTPSMTTLKTIHDQKRFENFSKTDLDHLFWKNKLGFEEVKSLKSFLREILVLDAGANTRAHIAGYL